jgi:hypothetical protein
MSKLPLALCGLRFRSTPKAISKSGDGRIQVLDSDGGFMSPNYSTGGPRS